ncbi:glycosyltransferase family 117 protein [Pseudofulvibacter geojedonensis]|uniref:DUF2723 domain-containing protein n=1 Tax=Pseudofulvibacter geojedonensis TaxID=1123758 RepID=A0ABW3I6W2_9FLAO
MTAKTFFKWNKIMAWVAFAIALITYSLTVEPTASFWDCGEYIATSANLAVGHPPGAPFFQMLGAFFAMFAFGNTENIALMVNMMSVFSSAFTILFMFWTISILARKLVVKNIEDLNGNKAKAILGSAFVGSLAFAFTDTFWFNAVETEVYAMATFIMSLMFWLALKWEENMHKPKGNKWLLLIAFVIGLSFGVHFMGLLTIPAIGLIYFFKNYKNVTPKNFIIANITAIAILLFIFKLLLPNALRLFGWMEVNIVNGLGLPFHSGTIITFLLVIAAFYYALTFTRKNGYVHANTFTLCILFIFIGFSSWVMLPIRANAGTTINENAPGNARELLAYYNLEQYPSNPFLWGPQFTDQYAGINTSDPYRDDKPKYEQDKKTGKYVIVNDFKNAINNPNENHVTFLPRMWSQGHAERYVSFIDVEVQPKTRFSGQKELRQLCAQFNNDVKQGNLTGEDKYDFIKEYKDYIEVKKPSTIENFSFMLQYQLGYMYVRYFMWNFAGRQDDIQGELNNNGNWISGINFIDEHLLGLPQDNLPEDIKENKGRNTYFFLPLILGILGLLFVAQRNLKLFWVLLVFFLFTGLAIQVYTNVRPFEPRERDYSVVGSFYVFSIWIGLGVLSLYYGLKKFLAPKISAPLATGLCLLAVPLLLANQNWDDHDRSGKATAQSMAKAYLDSCQENAILFTIGDNDTFALWYLQEIEKYRTDVRVINTSLFATDWYIDQMKKKAYESDPIPSQLTHDKYKWGTRDLTLFQERTKDTINIKTFMNFIAKDSEEVMVEMESGQKHHTFPTKNVRIPVDKASVIKHKIVPEKYYDRIVPNMYMKIKKDILGKQNLLMLDILANNNWERPIYFSGGSNDPAEFMWLKDYLQYDGLIYKLVPIHTKRDKDNPFDMGFIDTETSYNKIMKWDWGNSGGDIYHDPETRKNAFNYRASIARVAEKLIDEKQYKKAENLLDLAMEKMPVNKFELYTLVEPFIGGYYHINKDEKARKVYNDLAKVYKGHLDYYETLDLEEQSYIVDDILTDLERYKTIIITSIENKDSKIVSKEVPYFLNKVKSFQEIMNGVGYVMSFDQILGGLYQIDKEQARKLYQTEVKKVQKNLTRASKLPEDKMYYYAENILTDISDYKSLLRMVHKNDDSSYFNAEKLKFDKQLDQLENFFKAEGEE